jgi:hypothetical protein
MNRGFHGRHGVLGIGYGGVAGGMGVSPFLLAPALYQLSPSTITHVPEHSAATASVESHTEVSVALEYDP